MNRRLGCLLAVILILVGSSAAAPLNLRQSLISDDDYSGSPIYGKVVNNLGHGLSGVMVTAKCVETGDIYITSTDAKGRFGLDVLTFKTYDLRFDYNGNVITYNGKFTSGRNYYKVMFKPSFTLGGNQDWEWSNFTKSKVAATDYKLARLYVGKNQLFKTFYMYPLTDAGISYSKSKGEVGSRFESRNMSQNTVTFSAQNADFHLLDIDNGYFFIRFKEDSVCHFILSERDAFVTFSDKNPKVLEYGDGTRKNSFVLVGDGIIRSDRDEIEIYAQEGAALLAIPNTNVFTDSLINDLAKGNIGMLVEIVTLSNKETSFIPVLLSSEYSVSSPIVLNNSFSFNVSTIGQKKVSMIFSYDSTEYEIESLFINGEKPRTFLSSNEAMSLSTTPRTYILTNSNKKYYYLIMPDNDDVRIEGTYKQR